MDPQAIEAIGAFFVLSTLGAFSLAGYRMHLNAKIRLKKGAHEDNDRANEVVEQLEDQVRLLRDEIGDLQERMDFAERLLISGRQEREPSHTPV